MLIFALVLVVLLGLFIYDQIQKTNLKSHFKQGNVIVFGKKGKGKDVLFDYITSTRKKYYSNIPYSKTPYALITPKDLTFEYDIDYRLLIEGTYRKGKPLFEENIDVFLSDSGIFFPSQYDSSLHKMYPSFSVFYALSRHLYNMNVHANTQALSRLWKALREQADSYIKCLGVIKLPLFLVLKFRYYDKYSSAENDVRPIKRGLICNENKDIHNANVGVVKEGFIILLKPKIKYNSRIFKTMLLEEE